MPKLTSIDILIFFTLYWHYIIKWHPVVLMCISNRYIKYNKKKLTIKYKETNMRKVKHSLWMSSTCCAEAWHAYSSPFPKSIIKIVNDYRIVLKDPGLVPRIHSIWHYKKPLTISQWGMMLVNLAIWEAEARRSQI